MNLPNPVGSATELPSIVFLHGSGGPENARGVAKALNKALRRAGYTATAPLYDLLVIPDYHRALKKRLPRDANTNPVPKTAAAPFDPRARSAFALERSRTVKTLKKYRQNPGRDPKFVVVPDWAKDVAAHRWIDDEDLNQYLDQKKRRRYVWHRILEEWPTSDRVLVIGFSMGSVIAADLLARLPGGSSVSVLTMGSPLRYGRFEPRVWKLRKAFPYERVANWVDLRDHNDPASLKGKLSTTLPQAVDVKIQVHGEHDAGMYLAHKAAGAVVARFLGPDLIRLT